MRSFSEKTALLLVVLFLSFFSGAASAADGSYCEFALTTGKLVKTPYFRSQAEQDAYLDEVTRRGLKQNGNYPVCWSTTEASYNGDSDPVFNLNTASSKAPDQAQKNLAGLWGANNCLDGADMAVPISNGEYAAYSCGVEGCAGPFKMNREMQQKFMAAHHVKCANITDTKRAIQFVRTHLSSSGKPAAPNAVASNQQQKSGEDATRCLKLTSNNDGNAITNVCGQRVRYYFCGLDAGGPDRGAGVGVCPDIGGSELNPGQVKNLTQARSKTRYFYGGCFAPWVPLSGKFRGDRIVGMRCVHP